MDAMPVGVQLLHLLGGSAWLGGSLLANLVLVPFTFRQSPTRQRELVGALLIGPERLMIGAALTVAITGVLRGTVFGRIDSLDALSRPYGAIWLVVIITTLAVFAIGGRLTSPALHELADADALWTGSEGSDRRAALTRRVRIGFRAELVGVLAIAASMVILSRMG